MWVFHDPDWMQWIKECVRDNRLLFHSNHSQLGEQMKEFRPWQMCSSEIKLYVLTCPIWQGD